MFIRQMLGFGLSFTAAAAAGNAAPIPLFSDNFETDTAGAAADDADPGIQAGDVGASWVVAENVATYIGVRGTTNHYLHAISQRRATGENRYGGAIGVLTDASQTQNAVVTVTLNASATTATGGNTPSQGYGEIAGATGTAISSVGELTDPISFNLRINSETGLISYVNSSGAEVSTGLTTTTGTHAAALSNLIEIVVDYAAQTYNVSLNGNTTAAATGIGFRSASATTLTGLYVGSQIFIPAGPDSIHERSDAYYDNISVVVPEPASMSLLALGGAMVLGRRRAV